VNTWRVARPTAARALEALRAQGLVESRRGSGTYVRATTAPPRARERYERARDLGTMYSAAESIEFLATAVVAGPEHVLDALQLPGRGLRISVVSAECARDLFGRVGTIRLVWCQRGVLTDASAAA
jgi:DNA-binding GntR family transcriptional regulator